MMMEQKRQILKFFFTLTLISFSVLGLVSCVGTVEEGNALDTKYLDPSIGGFEYDGIIAARAIAHNKVELEFEPLFDASEYYYYLHVNEDTPIKLSLESLKDGQIGYLKYTLNNLNPNSTYKLRVSVEKHSGEKSTRENEVIVTTFDNKVAEFNGIVKVEPITGQTHTSARVSWVPSAMDGTYEPSFFDTKFYEITYIPTSQGLDKINVEGTVGREVVLVQVTDPTNNPNHVDITTLSPDTSYFFQVRAIHTLYYDQKAQNEIDQTPITVDREQNTSWLEYSTTPATGVYYFNGSSFQVKNALGQAGLTDVNLFWQPAEGIFSSYRIFYRKYSTDDGTDATLDDELLRPIIQTYINSGQTNYNPGSEPNVHYGYKEVPTSATTATITGLDKYAWYQFKIVPCRTVDCKVDPATDADSSSISDMVSIRIEPTLAPFYGINFLNDPKDPLKLDEITATFDSPALSLGFANKMKVYCLDDSMSSYVEFPEDHSPITGSGVGNCDGLRYLENINLTNTKKITIKGVKNINNDPLDEASYCFAMAPAIIGAGYETQELDRNSWVVRCIQPKIKAPTIEEFPGVSGGDCDVNQDTASVSWNLPTGGIYNKFRVFMYRKDLGQEKFKYVDVINNAGVNNGKYTDVTKLAADNSHLFTDLTPGKTYFVGVLAFSEGGAGYADDVYSEYNLNIAECKIPYPVASFDEYTRIFAIGPKIDGHVPTEGPNADFNARAFLWEAINEEGIPYETSRSGDYVAGFNVTSDNYLLSPGNFGVIFPTNFSSSGFDGKAQDGFAASNSGIISIAWKEVDLSFRDDTFISGQDYETRSTRAYGYAVYRSDDNKQTWKKVSDDSGLIHAGDYSYRTRSNTSPITERMAFFTDYSVKSMVAFGDNKEVDRARVYWYKIVPVYNNVELKFNDEGFSSQRSLIKVTLPPANMALVHRKMANRSQCLEMGLPIDKDQNYQCDYNGLGAVAKSSPWRVNETALDFKSDLLVDRFELGCNFTRGSDVALPKFENSYYNKSSISANLKTDLNDFKGFATNASLDDDETKVFRGCTLGNSFHSDLLNSTNTDDIDQLPSINYGAKQYDKMMYGDCIYQADLSITIGECSNPTNTSRYRTNYPGVPPTSNFNGGDGPDCQTVNNNNPNFLYGNGSTSVGLFDESFIDNVTIQAEHMAVLYNRDQKASLVISGYGPSGSLYNNSSMGGNQYTQNCYINLAAIGAEPGVGPAKWKSRWVSSNLLNYVKSDEDVGVTSSDIQNSMANKTLAEVHAESELYTTDSSSEYRVPNSTMWNNKRYNEDTEIGRIFSSNSSKLPPLTGFSRQEANRLCNTYKVSVGFSNDDLSYIELDSPKKKKLLTKRDFVAASAHPDGEMYTDERITLLERGSSAYENFRAETTGGGSCVGSNRVPPKDELSLNGQGQRTFATNVGPIDKTSSYLWTGSSSLDHAIYNSEECVSRYGIQDMVGNVGEVGTDVLSCDYRLDTLFFGEEGVASNSVTADGYLNEDDFSSYRRIYPRETAFWFWKNAKIVGSADPLTSLASNPKPWVNRSPESGYCSMVDNNSSRILNVNNFREASDILKSVFNFSGNLNTDLVKRINYVDPKAIESARSGDGYFVHSGPINLLPALGEYNDSLALVSRGIAGFDVDNQRVGSYFNPVLGLPLSCSKTNIDTCGDFASDNKRITTDELLDPSEPNYVIDDFPIGNSQILHYSLGTSSGLTQATIDTSTSEGASNTLYSIMTQVVVNGSDYSNLDNKEVTVVTKTAAQMISEGIITSGEVIELHKEEFNIPRHSLLHFINGGSFNDIVNGRFGMRVDNEIANENGIATEIYQVNGTADRSPVKGIRCGVRINEY